MAAVAAAGGRPAVPAENSANEPTHRMREAFINGLLIKLKRYLLSQPDNMSLDELCEKVSRDNVLDKLYPEDDPDTVFNEVSSTQMDSVATVLNSLNKAQATLQQKVNNMTNQIAALSLKDLPVTGILTTGKLSSHPKGTIENGMATIEAIEETIEAIEATIKVGEATEATTEAQPPMKM